MQPLSHNEGAAGVGGQVIANGARGLATGTAATAQVTALTTAMMLPFIGSGAVAETRCSPTKNNTIPAAITPSTAVRRTASSEARDRSAAAIDAGAAL